MTRAKPETPSRGMMPKVRAAIAAGKTDAQILQLRTPACPITPGVIRYARRTTKKVKAGPKVQVVKKLPAPAAAPAGKAKGAA